MRHFVRALCGSVHCASASHLLSLVAVTCIVRASTPLPNTLMYSSTGACCCCCGCMPRDCTGGAGRRGGSIEDCSGCRTEELLLLLLDTDAARCLCDGGGCGWPIAIAGKCTDMTFVGHLSCHCGFFHLSCMQRSLHPSLRHLFDALCSRARVQSPRVCSALSVQAIES